MEVRRGRLALHFAASRRVALTISKEPRFCGEIVMFEQTFVLTLACPNRPGIVAAVATYLFESGCNILDAQQFDDVPTDAFFMRVVFNRLENARAAEAIISDFAPLGQRFSMDWRLEYGSRCRRCGWHHSLCHGLRYNRVGASTCCCLRSGRRHHTGSPQRRWHSSQLLFA